MLTFPFALIIHLNGSGVSEGKNSSISVEMAAMEVLHSDLLSREAAISRVVPGSWAASSYHPVSNAAFILWPCFPWAPASQWPSMGRCWELGHTCSRWDSCNGQCLHRGPSWSGWEVFHRHWNLLLFSSPLFPLLEQLLALHRDLKALSAHSCSLSPAPFINISLLHFLFWLGSTS